MSSDAPATPSDEKTSNNEQTVSKPDASSGDEAAKNATPAPPATEHPPEEPAPPAAETSEESTSPDAAETPGEPAPAAKVESPDASTAGTQETTESSDTTDAGPDSLKARIQVGSRRTRSGGMITSSVPQTAAPKDPPIDSTEDAEAKKALQDTVVPSPTGEADDDVPDTGRPAKVEARVKKPSVRDPLPPDLEAELNSAMEDVSLDAIAEDTAVTSASQILEPEARCDGAIVRIHGDNVFLALGGRNEGVVSLRSFREPPSIGDTMEVVVKSYNVEDGFYEVFVPGTSIEVSGWSDLSEGAVVEARITGANTGGLECMVHNIRGFIPASQIGLFRVEDFAEFIGQKLYCVVTEVNRKRKNLVLSHRAMLEREKEQARQNLLEEIEPGQTREGVVRSIQDFGAFVDLGGVDGLIHISQLSWERVNHPSDVLKDGQKVEVKVEKVNRQTGKIALSYRELQEHPWAKVEEQFPEGATATGPVTRIAKFGAFVKLAPGVEGLIHISEMAHHRVRSVNDVVKEGEEVTVKILTVDQQAQRIALSIKAALPEPEPEEPSAEETAQDDSRPASQVPKRKRPLRGGFDRPTGGEHFGLKW